MLLGRLAVGRQPNEMTIRTKPVLRPIVRNHMHSRERRQYVSLRLGLEGEPPCLLAHHTQLSDAASIRLLVQTKTLDHLPF
jgi:hypothetical protein